MSCLCIINIRISRGRKNRISCLNCAKDVDERYIIDIEGEQFCSEDCLESYKEGHHLTYDALPNEDTYLMLRREYINLLYNWEDVLNKETTHLECAMDEMLEEIDKLIDDNTDFLDAEGHDGPYALEIYQYTLKMREFQKPFFHGGQIEKCYTVWTEVQRIIEFQMNSKNKSIIGFVPICI